MKESDILQGILQYLTYQFPKSFFWRSNNAPVPIKKKVGKNWIITGFRKSLVPGLSDILGCHEGRMIAIEVKAPRGKTTQAQENFLQEINNAGGLGFVARSIQDVAERIEE